MVSLSDLLDRLERVPQHSESRNHMYQAIIDIAVHGAHRGSHLPRRRYCGPWRGVPWVTSAVSIKAGLKPGSAARRHFLHGGLGGFAQASTRLSS